MRVVQILGAIIVFAAACGSDRPALKDTASSAVAASPGPVAVGAALVRYDAEPAARRVSVARFFADRKLIRTAELQIQVRDVPTALRLTDSIAQTQQTVLANSQTSQDGDGKRTAEVVLRVPSQQFAELLKSLRGLGVLQSEAIRAQDVTKDYADLETRLLVKHQTVTRLRALLENRTAKLSDVLEVERELGRAVAELEQMKGEQRYYDQEIAMSTVALTFFERVPSQMSQITKPIADAVHESMQVLGKSIGTVIYLVVALVPWAVATIAVAWLVMLLRRRFLPKTAVSVLPGR